MKKKSETGQAENLHWSLLHKKNSPLINKLTKSISTARTTGKKPVFSGASKSIFVGRANYPHVQAGVLSADIDDVQESAATWIRKGYSIEQIIKQRVGLVHAAQKSNVYQFKHQDLQAVAATKKQVDTEVKLNSIGSAAFHQKAESMPFGPRVQAQQVDLTSEPKIARVVDKVMSDDDIKASESCAELQNKIEEERIVQLFSSGALGNKEKRKLVPTRWSITAVDDTLGKNELQKVKTLDTAQTQIYIGGYTGNYCCVVFLEGNWSYELFEMHESGPGYTTDHEHFEGRKTYAENCAGGYYAARHAVIEKCMALNKQAQVLIFRIITDEYHTPLGVWVFKESVRNALQQKPILIGDRKLAITFAKEWAEKKFNYDLRPQIAASKLLSAGNQTNLFNF